MQPLFIFYLIIDKALMPICHDLPQTGASAAEHRSHHITGVIPVE